MCVLCPLAQQGSFSVVSGSRPGSSVAASNLRPEEAQMRVFEDTTPQEQGPVRWSRNNAILDAGQ